MDRDNSTLLLLEEVSNLRAQEAMFTYSESPRHRSLQLIVPDPTKKRAKLLEVSQALYIVSRRHTKNPLFIGGQIFDENCRVHD